MGAVATEVSRDLIAECFRPTLKWTLEDWGDDKEQNLDRYVAKLPGGLTASLVARHELYVDSCNLRIEDEKGRQLVNLKGKLPDALYYFLAGPGAKTDEWAGYATEDSSALQKAWTALKHLTSFRRAHIIEQIAIAVRGAPVGGIEQGSTWTSNEITHTFVHEGGISGSRNVGTEWKINFNGLNIRVIDLEDFGMLGSTAEVSQLRTSGKKGVSIRVNPKDIDPDAAFSQITVSDESGNIIFKSTGLRADRCGKILAKRRARHDAAAGAESPAR